MPGRNQPRSSRGRSAIARRVINTNSTNGLGIHEGGGMKKAGAHPSATGFMRSKPWQISVPTRKQLRFKRNIPNHTNHDTTDCDACTFENNPGCYIKDDSNISTNYCCIHHDGSGCIDASVTSVCHDKKSANKGDETCLTGRDFPDCSGGSPSPQPPSGCNAGKCSCGTPTCKETDCSNSAFLEWQTPNGCNSRSAWGCKWIPSNPCDCKPCKNGGTCKSVDDKAVCTCKTCFSGDYCTNIKCSNGCSGGEGCILMNKSECTCQCDENNCYESEGDKCVYKCKSSNCKPGEISVCDGKGICSCKPGLPQHIMSGYICPTCPSYAGATKNVFEQAITSNYNVIVVAFIVFGAYSPTGPNPLTKLIIKGDNGEGIDDNKLKEYIKDAKSQGKKVFLSVGGGDDAGIYDNYNTDTITTTIANSIIGVLKDFKFDGFDHDIEHRNGDIHSCGQAILKILVKIKKALPNILFACAPQVSNINPTQSIVSGGVNEYAPILGAKINYNGKEIFGHELFDLIQPQFYNADQSVYNAKYQTDYINNLIKGYNCSYIDKGTTKHDYTIQIPPQKLVMGYPASVHGAGSGYIDPTKLISEDWVGGLYKNGKIRGVMTWAIGWDSQNNMNWSEKMQKIFT